MDVAVIDTVTGNHFNFEKKNSYKGVATAPLAPPVDTPMGTTVVSVTALGSRGQ